MMNKSLNISTSPHITKGISTDYIMKQVVIALTPAAIFAVYSFGLNALLQIVVAIFTTVATEHFLAKISKTESTITDWSAVITGMIYGMTLPPAFPLWMNMMGGIIAITLGKYAFGGLGSNAFNPALVGRAVIQAAFPVAITTWSTAFTVNRFVSVSPSVLTFPFMEPLLDGTTSATPLSDFKFNQVSANAADLALGLVSGSTGETCAIVIVLGGLYLIIRKMMNWRIPLAMLGSVFLLSGLLYLVDSQIYPSPLFMLFSGGLLFGAMFMATDMVGSPITAQGAVVYGIFIGVLIVVIRIWGGLPEGVMYAILLGNAISPHLDNLLKNRVYGTGKSKIKK